MKFLLGKKVAEITPPESVFEVFKDNRPALRRYLRKILPLTPDIEDLLQEVFVRVYNAEQKTEIRSPKAFMFRTAHNLALMHLKSRAGKIHYDLDDPEHQIADDVPSVEDKVRYRQKYKIFSEAVEKLPPQCKSVFILRKIEGKSHKEISAEMGISPKTIEAHLTRALLACRSHMAKNGYDTRNKG